MKIQSKIHQQIIPTTQQPNDAYVPKTLKNKFFFLIDFQMISDPKIDKKSIKNIYQQITQTAQHQKLKMPTVP